MFTKQPSTAYHIINQSSHFGIAINFIPSTTTTTTQHRVSPNGTSRESGLPPYLLSRHGDDCQVVLSLRNQGRLNADFYPASALAGRTGVLGGSCHRWHAKAADGIDTRKRLVNDETPGSGNYLLWQCHVCGALR